MLVVDDNTMNLMVFKSLLKRTRLKIDMAESGDEGLKLIDDTKYDMIFLDHMMPEKDGIETLQEMRAKGGPNKETPAVCLTANAISGAREKYITEGFDNYLTKPIDAMQLERMLMHYLPEEKVEVITEEAARGNGVSDGSIESVGSSQSGGFDNPVPEEFKALDQEEWIDVAAGLKNSGNAEAYIPLLKIFYTSMDDKSREIEQYYGQGDLKKYTIKVHALKSSARIIGILDFAERAQLLENAGKAEDREYIEQNHADFMKDFASFREPLAQFFERQKAEEKADKPTADPDMMAAVYEELRLAAEDMDCDRLEAMIKEMEGYRIPDEEKWKQIKSAVEAYDYDGVAQLL